MKVHRIRDGTQSIDFASDDEILGKGLFQVDKLGTVTRGTLC